MTRTRVNVDPTQLKLRINRKTQIAARPAAEAAASLRQSQARYQMPRRGGGIGGGPIDIGTGQPRPIPGDPQDRPLPLPPRAPDAGPPGGGERETVSADEVLIRTALPEGPHAGKVSGFVYFPFT